LDPLRLHPLVDLQFLAPRQNIPAADLIILPGSKSVRMDLAWLREPGWEQAIQKHLRYGRKVIGICGGFQMLGMQINDLQGIESFSGEENGLGLLDIKTTLKPAKQSRNVRGTLNFKNATITCYEIHAGIIEGADLSIPVCLLDSGNDGAISNDNQIIGTYVHGLFEHTSACHALLTWAGLHSVNTLDYHAMQKADIERLEDTIEDNMDTQALRRLLHLSESSQ
jgi:adenosylcobyric acid synthase